MRRRRCLQESSRTSPPPWQAFIIYAASVFNDEIPMSAATFHGALREIVRVLAPGGFVMSRGSSGLLEAHLTPYGYMLLATPQVVVFQRDRGSRIP
jgi:hypothetical protein